MGTKYAVDSNFFKEWNPVMAYVLGFMYADGSIYCSVRGHYVVATSTDEAIILNLKRWMRSGHSITKVMPLQRKPRFTLRIGNKEIYNDLLKLGLYPNKSLSVRMPQIPDFVLKDFVRGNFDGDGCAYLYRSEGRTRDIILRHFSTIFTSGSNLFLEDLLKLLRRRLTLRQTKMYNSHRSFQLRFATNDSMALFKFMYRDVPGGLFFPRKYEIFRRYFVLRPQRVDKEVAKILQYVGNGHVAK